MIKQKKAQIENKGSHDLQEAIDEIKQKFSIAWNRFELQNSNGIITIKL